jgi:enoyl-CoA hydratase
VSVRIEKSRAVWTIIHARPEARNAMDPESADALQTAFLEFARDDAASVAVFWGEGGAFCAGWDLKHAAALASDDPLAELNFADDPADDPRGAMGPSRLELDKPVIAAIAGPAVAGGMELALWADIRVMEQSAYMGVYCRRWGIPLIDAGTVRLPRLVGEGRALDIILTGRKVTAGEALRIGLCEYVVEDGGARERAEQLAQEIARFPQSCARADRRSAIAQHGLSVRDALKQEWATSRNELKNGGLEGAGRFRDGSGRHGDFNKID